MRFFKFGSSRLKESEVEVIREQVRGIHDELVKRRKGNVADLYEYFVEKDYWPVDRREIGDDQKPAELPESPPESS